MNKVPVTLTRDVFVLVAGSKTSHPDDNNGEPYNQWTVAVVQGTKNHPDKAVRNRPEQIVVTAWHPTRESARRYARKIAKGINCPVREKSFFS